MISAHDPQPQADTTTTPAKQPSVTIPLSALATPPSPITQLRVPPSALATPFSPVASESSALDSVPQLPAVRIDSITQSQPKTTARTVLFPDESEDMKKLQAEVAQLKSQIEELKATRRDTLEDKREDRILVETVKNPAIDAWVRKLGEIQIAAIPNSDESRYIAQLAQLITQENFARDDKIQEQLRDLFPQLLDAQNAEQKLKTLAFTIEYYEALGREIDQNDYNALKEAYEREVKAIPAPGKTAAEKDKECYDKKIEEAQARHARYFKLKNDNLIFDCAKEIAKTAKPKANATHAEKHLLEQLTTITVIGLVDPTNRDNQKNCLELYEAAENLRTTTGNEIKVTSGIFYVSLFLATIVTASACAMFFGPMVAGIALSTFNEILAVTQALAAVSGYAIATSSFFSVKKAAPKDSFMTAVSKAYSNPTQYGKAVPEYNVANLAHHVVGHSDPAGYNALINSRKPRQ